MPTTGALSARAPHGAEEQRIPEVEDAPVGRDEPVALAGGGGGDADDRRIEGAPTHGAEEGCPAVVEDAAVGRGQEVPTRLAGRHAHDRGARAPAPSVTVVGEVPVPEQPPERGEDGVAAAVGAGDQADHLAVGGGRRAQRRRRRPWSSTARSAPRWRCRPRPRSCRWDRPSTAGRRRRPGTRCGPCRPPPGCTVRTGTGGTPSGRSRSPAARTRMRSRRSPVEQNGNPPLQPLSHEQVALQSM